MLKCLQSEDSLLGVLRTATMFGASAGIRRQLPLQSGVSTPDSDECARRRERNGALQAVPVRHVQGGARHLHERQSAFALLRGYSHSVDRQTKADEELYRLLKLYWPAHHKAGIVNLVMPQDDGL